MFLVLLSPLRKTLFIRCCQCDCVSTVLYYLSWKIYVKCFPPMFYADKSWRWDVKDSMHRLKYPKHGWSIPASFSQVTLRVTSVLLHHLWEISSNIPSGSYFINLNEAHIGAYRFCIQFYVETRGNDALLVENEVSPLPNMVK